MTAPQAMPASIRTFLADCQPEGIRVVDKSNWTGRAVVASRAQLGEALQRDELARAGVYALIGPGDGSDSRVYVGEGDNLHERVKKHATAKDFWTRFIARQPKQGARALSGIATGRAGSGREPMGGRQRQHARVAAAV